jgi:hypothetical protein
MQVLHDAFFKHQKKPAYLTAMGDMYYEGREFETKLAAQRPGVLSAELRAALGMGERDPPPYLANMQRVGPPISYPNLRIPGPSAVCCSPRLCRARSHRSSCSPDCCLGLNAPLPAGASWGFGPGASSSSSLFLLFLLSRRGTVVYVASDSQANGVVRRWISLAARSTAMFLAYVRPRPRPVFSSYR